MSTRTSGILLAAIFVLAAATASQGAELPDSLKVFKVTPVQERTCVAVSVPATAAQALVGIKWWHNDAGTAFARVLAAAGLTAEPPAYGDGYVLGESVAGAEMDWSEVQFAQPIASETGVIYVIFQLPANLEGVAPGDGPGFGYFETDGGSRIWISSDGLEWSPMAAGYQLAVEPVYNGGEKSAGSVLMLLRTGYTPPAEEIPEVVVSRTELLAPYPNPFNPEVTVAFTMLRPGKVTIDLYDVRGRLVRSLLSEYREYGVHEAKWQGRDDSGRRVASGVYFARMQTAGVDQVRRMTLVK